MFTLGIILLIIGVILLGIYTFAHIQQARYRKELEAAKPTGGLTWDKYVPPPAEITDEWKQKTLEAVVKPLVLPASPDWHVEGDEPATVPSPLTTLPVRTVSVPTPLSIKKKVTAKKKTVKKAIKKVAKKKTTPKKFHPGDTFTITQ